MNCENKNKLELHEDIIDYGRRLATLDYSLSNCVKSVFMRTFLQYEIKIHILNFTKATLKNTLELQTKLMSLSLHSSIEYTLKKITLEYCDEKAKITRTMADDVCTYYNNEEGSKYIWNRLFGYFFEDFNLYEKFLNEITNILGNNNDVMKFYNEKIPSYLEYRKLACETITEDIAKDGE